VNDAFVMDAWFRDQEIKNVKYIPDGSGEFTYAMGMSVNKANLGFGFRSWRYAMVVNNGEIEEIFEEPGRVGNCPADPYEISTPENVLNWLEQNK
jgi:thioredoxin-dependent peroxiredoxin